MHETQSDSWQHSALTSLGLFLGSSSGGFFFEVGRSRLRGGESLPGGGCWPSMLSGGAGGEGVVPGELLRLDATLYLWVSVLSDSDPPAGHSLAAFLIVTEVAGKKQRCDFQRVSSPNLAASSALISGPRPPPPSDKRFLASTHASRRQTRMRELQPRTAPPPSAK